MTGQRAERGDLTLGDLQGEDVLRAHSVDRIPEAAEMRARAEALGHFEQVGEGADQAVDPHHDQRIPLADPLQRASSTRLRLPPEARSSKVARQSASRSALSCGSVCCSSVETCA